MEVGCGRAHGHHEFVFRNPRRRHVRPATARRRRRAQPSRWSRRDGDGSGRGRNSLVSGCKLSTTQPTSTGSSGGGRRLPQR